MLLAIFVLLFIVHLCRCLERKEVVGRLRVSLADGPRHAHGAVDALAAPASNRDGGRWDAWRHRLPRTTTRNDNVRIPHTDNAWW